MTTALDIITSAAKLIGVLFKSETLASDEANDALTALNDMLGGWSNDNLITFAYVLENFPLTGAASYTIGSGGAFNTVRPVTIVDAVVRVGTIDYPLELISPEQYQTEIAYKSITSYVPKYITYDNAYPLATIKMYPVPSGGSTLYLQSNKPLTEFATLSATVDLPKGWNEALKYNLALRLAPEYGLKIDPIIAEHARKSLGAIRRSTSANGSFASMPQNARSWNIFGGWA